MAGEVALPIPISFIGGRYLLFSIDAISFLRVEHHILGTLIGSLPQCPQQNVFLGIPLQLSAEEARLLVELRIAYIADELLVQKQGLLSQTPEQRARYLQELQVQADEHQELALQAAKDRRARARERLTEIPDDDPEGDLQMIKVHVTPTTSPFFPSVTSSSTKLPKTPSSYPLFRHLHTLGYYLSPGLRFGCQYTAYPGDPLRYHSHFLCVSLHRNQKMPMIELVGGGRLGTGVKKAFLLGGEVEQEHQKENQGNVRAFCIEWGGM
jgi:tRNA-splicing endonuclease subunit Sen34